MSPPRWPFHLEQRYLRAIAGEWRRVNRDHLKDALRPPTFELIDSEDHLGRWTLSTRTIALSRALVHKQPWGVVVEVLRHEVAHQFAHEVLGAVDETAHGPAFRAVCARFGVDASAAGLPAPSDSDLRIHRRVERLLALAGSDNRHEAAAAMAEARRLLLVHNLDLRPSAYTWRHLGKPTKRVSPWWRQLATLLGTHFFVETLWVQVYDVASDGWKTQLEILGTPGNVDMAAWVHDWLIGTGERLYRKEKVTLGLAGAGDHTRYISGVVRGFSERLATGAEKSREEGLVWVGDPGVKRFLGERHGRLRTIKYTIHSGNSAFSAGVASGRDLVLHRPVESQTGGGGKRIGQSDPT